MAEREGWRGGRVIGDILVVWFEWCEVVLCDCVIELVLSDSVFTVDYCSLYIHLDSESTRSDYSCSGIFLVILLRALVGNVSDPLRTDSAGKSSLRNVSVMVRFHPEG